MENNHVNLIFDTNTLIHYKPLNEIKWDEIEELKGKDLVGYFIDPVIDEIDHHRYSERRRLQEKAKKITKTLDDIMSSEDNEVILDNNLILKIHSNYSQAPIEVSTRVDDQIIRYCLGNMNSFQNMIVVTQDRLFAIKLKNQGIKFIKLPEKYLLETEKSKIEAELDQTKIELSNLKNRIPRLSLLDSTAIDYTRFNKNRKEFVPIDIFKEMGKVREKFPKIKANEEKFLTNTLASTFNSILTLKKDDILKYNNELDSYYEKMEIYFKNQNEYLSVVNRVYELELTLSNSGTIAANDIRVKFHINIPKSVKMLCEDEYQDLISATKPEEPFAPIKPKTYMEMLQSFDKNSNNLLIPHIRRPHLPLLPIKESNSSTPIITQTNSYEVSFSVKKIPHKDDYAIEKMFIVFPEHFFVDDFVIQYEIICEETPNTSKGILKYPALKK